MVCRAERVKPRMVVIKAHNRGHPCKNATKLILCKQYLIQIFTCINTKKLNENQPFEATEVSQRFCLEIVLQSCQVELLSKKGHSGFKEACLIFPSLATKMLRILNRIRLSRRF